MFMLNLTKKVKSLMVKKIVDAENPRKIILFGSYAYGKPNKNSDIDLLVIKDGFSSKLAEKRKIREALKEFIVPKDILISTTKDYDFYSQDENWINSIYAAARKRGITLYEV
jgi:uncharacterized protein